MPLHLVTHSDYPYNLAFPGLGVLHANGKGPGISLKDAAQTLSVLQEKNPDGSLKTEDDSAGNPRPIPLTGNALSNAAKAWAEDFQGGGVITTVNRTEEDNAAKKEDLGIPADRPPLSEVAIAEYEHTFGDVEGVANAEPNSPEQREGTPTAGALTPPSSGTTNDKSGS